jgi:hypothetical protein
MDCKNRSSSRGNLIRERASSFERNQQNEYGGGSLPGSRRGSFSERGNGGGSAMGGARMDKYWQQTLNGEGSRPASRTDHEGKRWQSVGRLDTSEWEDKIRYKYNMIHNNIVLNVIKFELQH